MPKEVRRLVFAHQESTDAIMEYAKKVNLSFPKGRIIRAKFADDNPHHSDGRATRPDILKSYNVEHKHGSIIITFFDDSTFEHKFYNLSSDIVASALIEFCIQHKILLPKEAVKTVDVTEFNICLDINFNNSANLEESSLSFE